MSDYKVEAKGSLFTVTLSGGAYSDHWEEFHVFSGNSAEEVWEFVKIWAKNGGIDVYGIYGIIYKENRYQFKGTPDDISWDSSYSVCEVEIERLHVIYVNP